MTEHQCSEKVWNHGGYMKISCSRKGKIEGPDGLWYCKQHSPAAVKKRREESEAKYQEEYKKNRMTRKLNSHAPEMLAIIREVSEGPNDATGICADFIAKFDKA